MPDKVTIYCDLPDTVRDWLPKVAEHWKKPGPADAMGRQSMAPDPSTPEVWVRRRLLEITKNHGNGINQVRARGFVEYQKDATSRIKVSLADLELAKFKPVQTRGNFSIIVGDLLASRLPFVAALITQQHEKLSPSIGRKYESFEEWLTEYLTNEVTSGYTRYEDEAIEQDIEHPAPTPKAE